MKFFELFEVFSADCEAGITLKMKPEKFMQNDWTEKKKFSFSSSKETESKFKFFEVVCTACWKSRNAKMRTESESQKTKRRFYLKERK